VTASSEEVLAAVERLPDNPMIAGFHLEGPFISPVFPGAQPPQAILEVPQLPSSWDAVFEHSKLRLVTLAPEIPHALELCVRLMQRGVIVSMGHTNATFEESRRGFEFGVSHATHTFNAMRPFHHREAGAVGYVLQTDALKAELIYDRHHVCEDSVRLLLKCKGPDRIVAVSDGTMAIGLTAGTELSMWGQDSIKDKNSVRLKSGALAGSAITLLDAFQNLEADFGPEIAIALCCVNPRRALGMTEAPRVMLELNATREIVDRKVRVVA
jgi:N-acetylglucosamine-6-phosphate deacetylase